LGTVQEKANKPKEAMENFRLYLLAAPEGKDIADVKKRIYKLEYAVEQAIKGAFQTYTPPKGEFKISIPRNWKVDFGSIIYEFNSAKEDNGKYYVIYNPRTDDRRFIVLWYRVHRASRELNGYLRMFANSNDYSDQMIKTKISEDALYEKKQQITIGAYHYWTFAGPSPLMNPYDKSCKQIIKEMCYEGVYRFAVSDFEKEYGVSVLGDKVFEKGIYVLIGFSKTWDDQVATEQFKEFVKRFTPNAISGNP
jgi:hypothetical protein